MRLLMPLPRSCSSVANRGQRCYGKPGRIRPRLMECATCYRRQFGEGLGPRLSALPASAAAVVRLWAVHGKHYFMHPVSDSETGAASSIKESRVHNVDL